MTDDQLRGLAGLVEQRLCHVPVVHARVDHVGGYHSRHIAGGFIDQCQA